MNHNHADYSIVQVDCDRVFIVDLDRGNKSVTNDAEWVIDNIHKQYPGKRLIYRDSTGRWDEIVGKQVANFRMYNEYLPVGY